MACDRLKSELSSIKTHADKASTLLDERTDRFKKALAKKNKCLSHSKLDNKKLKTEIGGVIAEKRDAMLALKTDAAQKIEWDQMKVSIIYLNLFVLSFFLTQILLCFLFFAG